MDTYKSLLPKATNKINQSLNAKEFFRTPIGKEEIEATIFKPDWANYDVAYERFIESLKPGVSTDEKGRALESISCLSLSFISFFRVDPTVHTFINQIDVTVTIRPYFKYIEIPILQVIGRRILCECKNEDQNVPSLWVDKLAAGIDKVDGCRVGIIFSRKTKCEAVSCLTLVVASACDRGEHRGDTSRNPAERMRLWALKSFERKKRLKYKTAARRGKRKMIQNILERILLKK